MAKQMLLVYAVLVVSLIGSVCLAAPSSNEATAEQTPDVNSTTGEYIYSSDTTNDNETLPSNGTETLAPNGTAALFPPETPTAEVYLDPENLNERFLNCEQKIALEKPAYHTLSNETVYIPYLQAMLYKGDYYISGNLLVICVGS